MLPDTAAAKTVSPHLIATRADPVASATAQLGQIAEVIAFTCASATTNTVASEDVYYYHYDILGNVSFISDPDGDEADQFEQDAFGNLVSGSWSGRVGGITEQITTKPYDADMGLYYFNAPWYDPVVGGFLSTDPENPRVPYSLAMNAPPLYVDPTGLDSYLPQNVYGVSIVFLAETMDGKSSYQLVDDTLVTLFTGAVISAVASVIVASIRDDSWPENCCLNSISVFATTNGEHTRHPDGRPKSLHYFKKALDFSRINGIRMSSKDKCVLRITRILQEQADQCGAYENFGPAFRHKLGKPYNIGSHQDHVHWSVR